MITTKVFAAPTHIAYELLAKCRHLTLIGFEDGELEWVGTQQRFKDVLVEEEDILRNWDAQELIRTSDGIW